MAHMKWVKNDGGRKAAGFEGRSGDCVTRAIAIATAQPYQTVYDALSHGMKNQRNTKRGKAKSSARDGVNVTRKWFKDYMAGLGWVWTPTMTIGSGCQVHLVAGELPMGRLIVSVSKHYTCVLDGVVHDTFNPQRSVTWITPSVIPGFKPTMRVVERCVYGYWRKSQ